MPLPFGDDDTDQIDHFFQCASSLLEHRTEFVRIVGEKSENEDENEDGPGRMEETEWYGERETAIAPPHPLP